MNLLYIFSIILSLHCLAIDVTISESDNDGKILFFPLDPSLVVLDYATDPEWKYLVCKSKIDTYSGSQTFD